MTRAIVVAGGILCAALLSPAARTETEWKLEQVGTRLTGLSGVWGTSSQNVFAVGGRGVILHFDGSRWSRQESGTGKHLAAVWTGSRTEAFAVGLDGVILHFDGRGWERERSRTSKTLLAVWGVPSGRLCRRPRRDDSPLRREILDPAAESHTVRPDRGLGIVRERRPRGRRSRNDPALPRNALDAPGCLLRLPLAVRGARGNLRRQRLRGWLAAAERSAA